MAEKPACIRTLQPSDEKLVRFMIGKSIMEPLADANRRAVFHPLVISIWVALSSVMVQLLGWWPKPEYGWMTYLAPLPAFGSWGVAILFFLDWFNRPYFEDLLTLTLRKPDVGKIQEHYSLSPSSGFFILEYGGDFVGLIGIDASKESLQEKTIASMGERLDSKNKATSRIATIRHFHVEPPFRKAKIQNDLLKHALDHAFGASKTVQKVDGTDSPLVPYKTNCFKENGFGIEKTEGKLGLFGWALNLRTVDRATWEKAKKTRDS
ncbi:hypothetical protein SERLA73DRAFT_116601 [Serpula lacrymans var. lacrymans S7.3]|uniref:N-acetyltransferase domain-containing protein n=2 Tax=Serpula lacrymans var. lacrymans TaxID=341189 RepID=F8QFI1_SERL3|nr:uncharacterized protein SERLADRAFT_363988 [Serpula lacrymans var. lacrymans S7.9]EGN92965.1 hypothetical protein SERLA73DRAFT_116601 [Serpula lacrymans var. lacrymans S7.3]EGO19680.1 hypothetical protein SERLADRAFT_363988 [Serpula lacrymans var. lacrymans S7.9]